MCGISGFLKADQTREYLQATATAMAGALAHRGPDGSGVWAEPDPGIALSHRRLSIQDLSAAGKQPMKSHCGRFTLTYNGEVYNFHQLRKELEGCGCEFRGHSDTEVVLAGISEWGLGKTLDRMDGMFAFGLWDRKERTLTLARDRAGKKPLYYGWAGKTFLFASELKALHRHPDFHGEIDRDALALFLRYSWIPSPYSIFRNTYKLLPGSTLTVPAGQDPRSCQPESYWSAKDVAEGGERRPFEGSLQDATDELQRLLLEATQQRMISDVSLGALLSGGFDSTTIVSLMQSLASSPVRTFSIGFHEAGFNEAEHARVIARHLGTDHTELYVTAREAMQVIPQLPELYDEPFADASQIPTFLVSKLARSDVTVALTGDGGDELMAGYSRYASSLENWKKLEGTSRIIRRAGASAACLVAGQGLAALGRLSTRDSGWPAAIGTALAKLGRKSPRWRSKDAVDFFCRASTHDQAGVHLLPGAAEVPTIFNDKNLQAAVRDPLQAMMLLDFMGFMTDDILVKVDRASMGVSLEVRCPLLDHHVVEFAWSLPMPFRAGPGGSKRVLRELLARYVPTKLTDRPKAGFNVPVGEWLRGPLREWAEKLLDPACLDQHGLLDNRSVQQLWQQHLSGWRNHKNLVWNILMFQSWFQRWGGA